MNLKNNLFTEQVFTKLSDSFSLLLSKSFYSILSLPRNVHCSKTCITLLLHSLLSSFSFHNLRELNPSNILDRGSLWLVPSQLTLDEWWLVLVPKLWFFLVGGLQKVKARVQIKYLKISVISKKKVLCNNKIN